MRDSCHLYLHMDTNIDLHIVKRKKKSSLKRLNIQ